VEILTMKETGEEKKRILIGIISDLDIWAE
jgi:hypothetical protein